MIKYIFSDCEYISLGCKFYLDRNLETIATAGKYSDGTNCFSVNSLGLVTSVNACSEFTTTTSTTSTSTSTSTSTTTTTLNPSSNGQYSSLIQLSGSGQAQWKTPGIGATPCASGSWTYGPTPMNIGGSGIDSYTVYTGSVELVSGTWRNQIINGVQVDGIIFTPISNAFQCGQSPLFVQKVLAGTNTTSSLAILPNTSIPMAAGDKLQYWVRTSAPTSTARTHPPDYAITGSSVSYITFNVAPNYVYSHVWATQTFTSSGNFYYNAFSNP